jgi:UDP-glucose 4-epimerase
VQTRISVTGGAGFLGTHLLHTLRVERPDARLFAVVRTPPVEPVPGVEYVSAVPPADLVFHLAGSRGIDASLEDPRRDFLDNALATLELLEALRRMPGARVVVASSAAVYGRADGVVTEERPLRPLSPYGVSKLAAESYVRAYTHRHGVDGRIARIANAYGPGLCRLAIYDLVHRALHEAPPLHVRRTGAEVRDFVYASDVAQALVTIALRGAPGEAYNVASGHAVTLREVAGLIARAADMPEGAVVVEEAAMSGPVDALRPSIDKLSELGYRAATPLERGIAETVAWVKAR